MRQLLAALACSSICLAQAAPPVSVPRAVIADAPRDAAHPAANRQVVILSHGDGMNALFLLAAGAGAMLIDPWNIGATGKEVLAKPETRQDAIADLGEGFGNSLAGTDARV